MSLIQLFVIAIIQGITEWLPISSSGHVMLAADWYGLEGRDQLAINAVSNLGTLAAMLVYFRNDVARAILGGFELLIAPFKKSGMSRNAKLALHIIVATPFTIIGAALFMKFVSSEIQDTYFQTPYVVAATTIIFGIALWWADVRGEKTRGEEDMTIAHSFWIGATQLIAVLLPGTSRSGITMTAARAFGYARTEAARFSMLIGAPLFAAVSVFGLLELLGAEASAGDVVTLQDGLIVAGVAFISGIISIAALMAILKRMSFLPFVLYRLVLGGLLLAASPLWLGWIG